MSTRTTLRPQVVITAGDMSDDIVSTPTILQSLSRLSYAVSWSGTTPVGTVSVQVSNDYALDADGRTAANAGTWNTITLQYSGTTVTEVPVSGNTGNGFIDVESAAAYAARLIYTSGSGTGSLKATVNGKVS